MTTKKRSFRRMPLLTTIFVFFLYLPLSLSADGYTWYLFPSATNRLYGYRPQSNQSFESEPLPSGSYVTKEDNVNGLLVPAGETVSLGDFSAQCLSNSTVCENFTVSFLFKINGSIAENETVDVIHQMPVSDAAHRVHFTMMQNSSHYTGVAVIARGDNRTEVTGAISLMESWIHVAIIYTGPGYLELFLNGTNEGSNASSVPYSGSVTEVNMTLGSSNSSSGFLVSYLQVIEGAISNQADVDSLKDGSFAQAINPNDTSVTVSQSSRVFNESDGTVTIFIERYGNLALVSVVTYSLSAGTATNSSDFIFQDSPNGQFIFKPGETTKSLSVDITGDTLPEMNETLLLNLTSNDGITITDNSVAIYILDNDIDECAGQPCQNNGNCTDLVSNYKCACTPGYTGKNCSLDTYVWYLFPVGANRLYGYEPMTNQSFVSDELSPGTQVAIKGNTHSIYIPRGNGIILGEFAKACLESACSSFSISFLVYISGPVAVDEKVYVLNSSDPGPYLLQFIVSRGAGKARLEGQAFVVGGGSRKLLQRKMEFPATDSWVHVAIVYSMNDSLVLYMNGVKVGSSDAIIPTDWPSDNSSVEVSLGSKENLRDIFVSYLQIIKGALTTAEVAQLEQESREQAVSPSMAQLELTQENIAESEGDGSITVPLSRTGNLVVATVVKYSIKNGTATLGADFEVNVPTSDEVIFRPGKTSAEISLVIDNDTLHEPNETFSVTVSTSDNVTVFSTTTVNLTIIDNDIDECSSSPCVNGGTCEDLHLDFKCNCLAGYTGKNCSTDIDECSSYPCQNGGTCFNEINNYTCSCAAGYTGRNCSINVDDCDPHPCQNSGNCTDLVNDYNCSCIPGYTGRNCTKDSYLWYLFPTGGDRVYGYDTANNQSFDSDPLPAGTSVSQKGAFRGLCIPAASQLILGDFANQCLRNASICDSFTISFLAYVKGSVPQNEDVDILHSTPLNQGQYHVQFTVTKTVSRLEGQASIVGGNSASLLQRTGTFPGVDRWVHVAILYSRSSQELNLYFDSVKVTDPNSTIAWNNTGQRVNVSLASTGNKRETCVSYFQIIGNTLTEPEIQQLEQECRQQAASPRTMVEAKFLHSSFVADEGVGTFTIPLTRQGNIFIASVLKYNSTNGDAVFNTDFNHQLNQEVVVKPGEKYSSISVNITDDVKPENNETFVMTLTTSDDVTAINDDSTTVTILNNDIDECEPAPCQNGATCTDLELNYTCSCVVGFMGRNCSINIDDCHVNPCVNNGTCNDLINDFNCTCAPGYTGKNCSNDFDECSVSPCQNGGQCTNLMNDYSCKCADGFEGKDCSTVSASTGEDDKEVLRILFWACVGTLAFSLLVLIIAATYFCSKLNGAARRKRKRASDGWQYTSYNGASTL